MLNKAVRVKCLLRLNSLKREIGSNHPMQQWGT